MRLCWLTHDIKCTAPFAYVGSHGVWGWSADVISCQKCAPGLDRIPTSFLRWAYIRCAMIASSSEYAISYTNPVLGSLRQYPKNLSLIFPKRRTCTSSVEQLLGWWPVSVWTLIISCPWQPWYDPFQQNEEQRSAHPPSLRSLNLSPSHEERNRFTCGSLYLSLPIHSWVRRNAFNRSSAFSFVFLDARPLQCFQIPVLTRRTRQKSSLLWRYVVTKFPFYTAAWTECPRSPSASSVV